PTRPPWSVPVSVTSWPWVACARAADATPSVMRSTSKVFICFHLYCSRFPGMSSRFAAAVIQSAPVVFEPNATLAKVRDLTADAGLDFGARVGSRTFKGRDDFRKYFDSATDVPGWATEHLARTAKESGVHLVIGVIERDIGTLYCTILFFASDGTFLGKHRKLMPTAMERLIWGFGDGSTLPVFD